MDLTNNKERTQILYNTTISSIKINKKKLVNKYFIPIEIPIKKFSYWKGENVIVGYEKIKGRKSIYNMDTQENIDNHYNEYNSGYFPRYGKDLEEFKIEMNNKDNLMYEFISDEFNVLGNYNIYEKPYLELYLENYYFQCIYFDTDNEMNDYLDKLIIKIGKPHIVI